jgi:hypothetical protein
MKRLDPIAEDLAALEALAEGRRRRIAIGRVRVPDEFGRRWAETPLPVTLADLVAAEPAIDDAQPDDSSTKIETET